MTKRVGNVIYQEREPPTKCSVCGEIRECRPYGPNGRQICIVCVHKPEYLQEGIVRTTDRFKGVSKVIKVVTQNG